MGQEKKGGSGGKKLAVTLSILILLAIVVVIIIVSIPANTQNAVQTLNRAVERNYLSSVDEQVEYNRFRNKISSSTVGVYAGELDDIEILTNKIGETLDFYDDYLVFAKGNATLQKNYKAIKEGLQNALNSQKRLEQMVAETNKLSDNSSTYLKSAIVDFREEYLNYLSSSKRAIKGLSNVCKNSLGKTTFTNSATNLRLDIVNDYLTVIEKQFKAIIEIDVKGSDISKYNLKYKELNIKGKIACFDNFNVEVVNDYYFDEQVEEEYAKLIQFYEIYGEKDTVMLIDSIEGNAPNYTISKVYEGITDTDGVLDAMKDFIV